MAQSALNVREPADGCCEIEIVGEFDLEAAPQVQETMEEHDGSVLLFNLEACEFIDSTGIAVIVQAAKTAEATGRGIAAFGCSGQVERVFDITGLLGRDFVQPDRTAALAHLRASGSE
ncbi:MAG TPA: STAS domain-containing protein [Solirubrobacterales bacterium]|nr:STAS domain-containing protein [Solirubrobacterales bacterium]